MKAQNIKLVCVGDGTVGKTCVLLSYVNNEFPKDYVPTIFENYVKNINKKKIDIQLSLWDTAGQEEYKKLRSISYPFTDVFLIIFDVSRQESFDNAINKWYPEIKKFKSQIIFVCNKIDLKNQKNLEQLIENESNQTNKDTLIDQKEMGFEYMECSALTRQGLVEVFDKAIDLVLLQKNVIQKKKICNII